VRGGRIVHLPERDANREAVLLGIVRELAAELRPGGRADPRGRVGPPREAKTRSYCGQEAQTVHMPAWSMSSGVCRMPA